MCTVHRPCDDAADADAREISLRAHWLHSLSEGQRECLIDLPLTTVEQRFLDWRRRTQSDG